jgi:hypothetical protein
VFNDVVGEKLPEELRIKYTLFPEGKLHQTFLSDVANLLIYSETKQHEILHNKKAVRTRYNYTSLKNKFEILLNQLYKLD